MKSEGSFRADIPAEEVEVEVQKATTLDRAYEKAVETTKDAFQEDAFRDMYGDAMVDREKAEVARLEAIFAEQDRRDDIQPERVVEMNRRGVVLEGFLEQQIEKSNYLGAGAKLFKTARADDVLRGIDAVAVIEPQGLNGMLGLNIDATLHHDPTRKLERIAKNIQDQHLSTLKYFQYKNIRGEISDIPSTVLAVSQPTFKDLTALWVRDMESALEHHPFQLMMIEQIIWQCETFAKLSERNRFDVGVEQYRGMEKFMRKLRGEKEEQLQMPVNAPIIAEDPAMGSLDRSLSSIEYRYRLRQ